MSNALLASLSILTQIDTSKLDKGAKETEDRVAKMVDDVSGVEKIGDSFDAAGESVKPFLEEAAKLGGQLLNLKTLTAGGIFYTLMSELDRLDDLSADAAKIGVTAQSLAELQHAAVMSDVGVDELQAGLQKLLTIFGQAVGGSESATAAFGNIGLEIEKLQGLTATQLFAVVAEELRMIADDSVRAAHGAAIFGKGFAELNPLIEQGKAGISELADEAGRLGLVLSEETLAGIERTNDAIDKSKQRMAGLRATLAGEGAPVVEDLIGLKDKAAEGLAFFGALASSAFYSTAAVASHLVGAEDMAHGFAEGLESTSEVLDRLTHRVPQATDQVYTLGDAGKKSADVFREAWFDVSDDIKEEITKTIEQTKKSADQLWEKWQLQIETANMTPHEAEIHSLGKKGLDASRRQELEEQRKILELIEAQKRATDAATRAREDEWAMFQRLAQADKDRAKALTESLKTPEQKFQDFQRELERLLKEEFITLPQFIQLRERAYEKLDAQGPLPFAGAAVAGSNEAREIILRSSVMGKQDPWIALAKAENDQVALQKLMEAHLKQIAADKRPVAPANF